MLQAGVAAPDINLPDLDGTPWSLREALKQGPVVLAFFKVSCPTCQMTFPFLQRLADSPDSRSRLIAISQDDVPDSREFLQRFGIHMPALIDAPPRYSAGDAYRITSVPSIFEIEMNGTIVSAVEGFNKAALQKLGQRFGVAPFLDGEHVPSFQPG